MIDGTGENISDRPACKEGSAGSRDAKDERRLESV